MLSETPFKIKGLDQTHLKTNKWSLCNQWLNTLITSIEYILSVLFNIFLCHNKLKGIKRATKIPSDLFSLILMVCLMETGNRTHHIFSLHKFPEITTLKWNDIAKTFAKHQFHYLTILNKTNNTDLQSNRGSELSSWKIWSCSERANSRSETRGEMCSRGRDMIKIFDQTKNTNQDR